MRAGERAGRPRNVFEDLRQGLAQNAPGAPESRSWTAICRMLQQRLGAERFLAWIRHVAGAALDERALTVAFTSRRARSEAQAQMLDAVTACARAVTQRPVAVVFTVGPAPAGAELPAPATLRSHHAHPRANSSELVRGTANETACKALTACLAGTRPEFVPLLLHGPPGCGKTRLLELGEEIARANPRVRGVLRASAEEFTGQFTFSVQRGQLPAFQQKYRSPDVLLLDDVHGLAGKPATQIELLHTFDALEQSARRVVVSSLWPGRDLRGIDPRLRVRLKSGLEVRVGLPDRAMRRAAVARWNQTRPRPLSGELAEAVADGLEAPLGLLRRAFEDVAALRSPSHVGVEDVLARVAAGAPRALTLQDVERAVTAAFGVGGEELRAKGRARRISLPRQVCFWLSRRLAGYSAHEIGTWWGGRDRATVLAGQDRVERRAEEDPEFRVRLEEIERAVGAAGPREPGGHESTS